jgi:hypothetical protein
MKITDPKDTQLVEDFISQKLDVILKNYANPIIIKTNDIRQNITNGYYDARAHNIDFSIIKRISEEIHEDLSNFIDKHYHGSIFMYILKHSEKFFKIYIKEKNKPQNSDTWYNDLKKEWDLNDEVFYKLSGIIYEYKEDNSEYEKYDFAIELLEFRNMK